MYKNKKVFILGNDKNEMSVSKVLCKDNHVLLTYNKYDNRDVIEELEEEGINVIVTNKQEEVFNTSYDFVVKSPLIQNNHKVILEAKKNSIPVIDEIEVAYNSLPKNVRIIGVTGSNGKTTTVHLIHEILKLATLPVHICGNAPLCSILDTIKENDIVVLEISSHQLINLDRFKTNISVLTNLNQVYHSEFNSYENYKKTKLRIFNHHTDKDIAIINGNDETIAETKNIPSKKIYFSSDKKLDCYIEEGKIWYKNEACCEINDIRLKGKHNYENVMCAIMVAKEFGIGNDIIKEALDNFSGIPHCIEFVRRINDIEFYNDSKSTNNYSTIVALSSFDNPIILLLGGLDRGQSFNELSKYLNNVKHVICFGQTKYKIKNYCEKVGIDVTVVDDLEEGVKLAYNLAIPHETILFSPACASTDQFKSLEDRGERFKEIVNLLKEEK